MKKAFFLILGFIVTLSIFSQTQSAVKVLEKNDFKEAVVGKNVQLVDVRTPDEYNAGHIDDAINIDFFDKENFNSSFEKLDKNKAVYIYCKSGGRSGKSAMLLKKMGFTEIYDLSGGYSSWK